MSSSHKSPDEIHYSEALLPELLVHLEAFLRSFLKNELPDAVAGVVRDEISQLRQEIEASRKQITEEAEALFDTHQTCTRLNISPRKLDQLVAAGELRPLRIGRKRLFPIAQIKAFLRRCER